MRGSVFMAPSGRGLRRENDSTRGESREGSRPRGAGAGGVAPAVEAEDRQRRPDRREADEVRNRQRLPERQHRQQELQRRRDILKEAEQRIRQPAGGGGEHQQRDRGDRSTEREQ